MQHLIEIKDYVNHPSQKNTPTKTLRKEIASMVADVRQDGNLYQQFIQAVAGEDGRYDGILPGEVVEAVNAFEIAMKEEKSTKVAGARSSDDEDLDSDDKSAASTTVPGPKELKKIAKKERKEAAARAAAEEIASINSSLHSSKTGESFVAGWNHSKDWTAESEEVEVDVNHKDDGLVEPPTTVVMPGTHYAAQAAKAEALDLEGFTVINGKTFSNADIAAILKMDTDKNKGINRTEFFANDLLFLDVLSDPQFTEEATAKTRGIKIKSGKVVTLKEAKVVNVKMIVYHSVNEYNESAASHLGMAQSSANELVRAMHGNNSMVAVGRLNTFISKRVIDLQEKQKTRLMATKAALPPKGPSHDGKGTGRFR